MDAKRFQIRAVADGDRNWVRSLLQQRWGGAEIVTRGRIHRADRLRGFIALEAEQPVGLVTYAMEDGQCEIVSLDSLKERTGVGSALIRAVVDLARAQRCRRVWLITTNDNTRALCIFQKMDFVLAAIHRNAVAKARQLKPGIPESGHDGIPIRDEIELEMRM
jgi:ribosomal protein S18 acetylase RimI-like enzyme